MDTPRVLFLDDEPSMLRAFARCVSDRGAEVETTDSHARALELAAGDRFHVIASDFRMPGMNGAEFFRRCRAIAPEASRLLITGDCDFKVAAAAVNEGAVDRILAKPWDADDLWATLLQEVERNRLRRENARLQRELEEANRDLYRRVQERTGQVLEAFVAALDLRDTETRWHSRRVAAYTRRIAGRLGVAEPELTEIEHGALLHDIGKIGVRDAVLLKPGRLTGHEWDEMRRHPALGYHLLDGIDFLEPARLIVLHHQESWDGSGYPMGLRGDQICLGARIFTVADTLDAITSDRPYRRAQSFAAARAEIERCTGTQFDPAVVEAYLSIPDDEWRSMRARYSELAGEPAGARDTAG